MKLTSEVQRQETQWPAVSYPSLWYSGGNDMVVLLLGAGEGVVVKASKVVSLYRIGYYSETWDMHSFVPFYGTVTLKSEAA